MQKEQRKRMEKEIRDRRTRDQDDPEHENNRGLNMQHFPDKKRSGRKIEGFASYDEKDTLKSESINLFDRFYIVIIHNFCFPFLKHIIGICIYGV